MKLLLKTSILFSALLLLISFSSKATDPDTTYIQTFSNIFALKTFVNQNAFEYTITPRNNDAYTARQLKDARVVYTPNIPATFGVSVNIKGIGASYSFKMKNDFNDTINHARSSFQQFTFDYYKNIFGIEAYYQDYRRFYYHFIGDQYLFRNYNSDIRAYQLGVNGMFLFNGKKFSYNAAFNQAAMQKKSAGSVLLMMSLKFNEIKGDDLIPESVRKYYYSGSYLYRNRNYGFQISPGYAFNLSKRDFYFSGAVLAGVGIQLQSYNYVNGSLSGRIAFPLIGRAKTSIGYNGKYFFAGLYGNYDINQSVIKSMQTQQMLYSYGVFIGGRAIRFTKTKGQLKAEEKLERFAEKATRKKERDAAKQKKESTKKVKQPKKKKEKTVKTDEDY